MLCFRVVEPMGFAKRMLKVMVEMGRSKHTFNKIAERSIESSRLISI